MRRLALPPQVGWPGATAVLALALTWPLATVLTPRWQDQAQALRATRLSPPPPALVAAEAQLPAVTDVNARVADLLEIASSNRVQVERSQQRQDEAGPVPRLLLTMSARGGYAELREFLADALQADPGLALVRLRWRRPDAQTSSLEAELQWSLLMPTVSPTVSPDGDAGAGVGPLAPALAMKRRTLMLGALGATLAATAYLALQPEAEAPASAVPAAARPRVAIAAQRPPAAAHTPRARPAPDSARSLGWPLLSPGALAAWAPPAPPPQPPAPVPSAASSEPVKPRPPAFPYRWIGLLMQDGQATALLDSSQRSLGVQAGQVLDQRWRVERIAADRIDLIWLPTGDAVTLDQR